MDDARSVLDDLEAPLLEQNNDNGDSEEVSLSVDLTFKL